MGAYLTRADIQGNAWIFFTANALVKSGAPGDNWRGIAERPTAYLNYDSKKYYC
jgi:hypothetical protein